MPTDLTQPTAGRPAAIAAAPGGRLLWPDAMRGLTIFFIIVFHAAQLTQGGGVADKALLEFIAFYQLAGLALFFAVSGMNSRRYIDTDWRTCWAQRLGPLVWMVVLWSIIDSVLWTIFPNAAHPGFAGSLIWLLVSWISPQFTWFIWAMTAYLVLARMAARVPDWLVFLLSGSVTVIMVGASDWHWRKYGFAPLADHYTWRMSLTFFPFFYAGYLYRERILWVGSFALLPGVLLFRGASLVLMWWRGHIPSVLISGVVGLIGLILGLIGSIYIARVLLLVPGLRKALLWVGRLTLPIYLMHLIFLVPLIALLRALHAFGPNSTLALTIVSALVSIAGALAANFIFARLGWTWLYSPPAFLTRALGRSRNINQGIFQREA